MQPLILVDGPKSEFRHKVAADLAAKYVSFHAVGHVLTTPETYVRMMSPAIDSQRPVVIECSWITQERHQHLMTPVNRLWFAQHFAQRRMLERLALGCGAVLIQCLDVSAPLQKEWIGVDHTLTTLSVGDWDEYLYQDLEYKLINARNPGPGIGKWTRHESILIVGDQHGDTVQPYNVHRNIAFCSMSGKGCSEWLTIQLAEAGFKENQFYWINAREPKPGGGKATSSVFVDDLNPIMTIALGSMAEQWCMKAGIPYRAVPHPQSWKRFHYHDEYPLIPLLKNLLANQYGQEH